MAKTKTPFFGLGSQGSIGQVLTSQKRGSETLLREKPTPANPRSLPQMYQRWLYEDYAYLWRQQSAATRAQYRSAGSCYHLTGFQYWMKYQLTHMPDIIGLWHLDGPSAAVYLDYSRNNNDLFIIGASPATGIIDGAPYFDGINDYLFLLSNSTLDLTTALTLELFLRTSVLANQGLISRGIHPTRDYGLNLRPSGRLSLRIRTTAAYTETPDTGTNLADNAFHHGAGTWDGTTMRRYADGQEEPNPTPLAGTIISTNRRLALGYFDEAPPFILDGFLDHAILYNRALDATEILRHSLRRYPL